MSNFDSIKRANEILARAREYRENNPEWFQ
jgi:hypothetical protein